MDLAKTQVFIIYSPTQKLGLLNIRLPENIRQQEPNNPKSIFYKIGEPIADI